MSGLRLGGHPVHPMLVHFPVASWTVAVGADAAGWLTRDVLWWQISFGSQALGALVAALAMLAGFVDYAALEREHPAQSTTVTHMLVMCTAWLSFLISLALRGLPGVEPPTPWASAAAAVGFVTMAFGGWVGGTLVYRFGVGMTERP